MFVEIWSTPTRPAQLVTFYKEMPKDFHSSEHVLHPPQSSSERWDLEGQIHIDKLADLEELWACINGSAGYHPNSGLKSHLKE